MSQSLRMPDINSVALAGNLTRDTELRYVGDTPLCKFGLAVSRKYKAKSGELKEDVLFINVEQWGPAAEWLDKELKKGSPVHVQGRLKSDEWTDKDGNKRSTIGIRADRVQPLSWGTEKGAASKPVERMDEQADMDDGIPF